MTAEQSHPPLLPRDAARPMVLVVAGVLIDKENRFLLAQRPEGKSLSGLWEFPGGKVHDGELPEDALARELYEELAVVIAPKDFFPLTFVSHPYPDFHLLMLLFGCRVWQGLPHPREKQNLLWTDKDDVRRYAMPPADERILPLILNNLSARP